LNSSGGFKYVELFAGIGGFRSALDKLGGTCVFASENDKYATQAYKALYNGATELHGDITQIDAEDISDADLYVCGFPCQSFSVAGQRKGFEDTRGTLFFEIARIASAKQPRLMLLENVKGLLSHDGGKTFETMCAVLNDIGYAIDFRVLNSKYFGVPQNRERIFIVASRDAEHVEWDVKGADVVSKAKRRIQALGVRTFNFDWPTNDTVTTRLRDILEDSVDERYYLSEEKTAKLIEQLSERERDTVECEMLGLLDMKGNETVRRVYSPTGVAPTLTTMGGGHREPKIAELQQYSDGEGISYTVDANYAKGTSPGDIRPVLTPDREEKRQNGRRFKEDGEPMFTLTAQDRHGVAILRPVRTEYGKEIRNQYENGEEVFRVIGSTQKKAYVGDGSESPTLTSAMGTGGGHVPMIEKPRYRIRKLTPLECWRLQGFTDTQHETVKNAGVSDSQRYNGG
jgi:DNA (cytosine-5)-methyltransferase 1